MVEEASPEEPPPSDTPQVVALKAAKDLPLSLTDAALALAAEELHHLLQSVPLCLQQQQPPPKMQLHP